MASGPAPLASSKETTNYARLCRLLVDMGTQALRETFDRIHPPNILHKILSGAHPTLQSLRTKGILNPTQWGKLYPTAPSSVSSASFDITLLMVLLRNICSFSPPASTGSWDKLPPSRDNSIEANIARIKYYRNGVYGHASQASVDDVTFNMLWQDITNALLALGSGTNHASAISQLKTECMDPDFEEHYQELLKQWKKDDDNTKETLEEIKEMLKQLKSDEDSTKHKLGQVEEVLTTWKREEGDTKDRLGEMEDILKRLETDEGSSKDTPKEAHKMSRHLKDKFGEMEGAYGPAADVIDDIRQLYKRREGWHAPFLWCEEFRFHLDNIFTRLKMVSRKKERGLKIDSIVNMLEIFKPHKECPQPKRVLIEGEPGIGKTTYCNKVAYDWAKNRKPGDCFPDVQVLLLLKCRNITSDLWEAIDDQLLPEDIKKEGREKFFTFIRDHQSKVLLVLDGLDELPTHTLPVYEEIIRGRMLSKCYLIVTARHKAGIKVRACCDTLLEVEGFTKYDAEDFISRYFKTEEHLAEELLERLRSDASLREVTANPLNAALLCLLCEDVQGDLPKGKTLLYVEIVQCVLRRYRTKKELPETDEDLTQLYHTELEHLGCIALNGLLNDEMYFNDSAFQNGTGNLIPDLGFLSAQPGRSKRSPSRCYGFLHKSFQEFFAALYLSCRLANEEISPDGLLADTRYFKEFQQVLLFTCGILAQRCEAKAMALVASIASQINQPNEKESNNYLWTALNCIKESENEQGTFGKELARSLGSLLETQCVSYRQQMGDSGAAILAHAMATNSTLTKLYLSGNGIGDTGAAALAKAVEINSTLTELYLSGNGIGDTGATALAKAVEINSTLATLGLSGNGIGDSGAAALAEAVEINSTLTGLNLSDNQIGDLGVAALAKAVEISSTLTELYLSGNGIGDTGAAALAKAVEINSTLTKLHLFSNGIGDSGAAALAKAVEINSTLTTLGLSGNGIGDLGVAALAKAVEISSTLTDLYLSGNEFSDSEMLRSEVGEVKDIPKRTKTDKGSSKDTLKEAHVLPEEINLRGPLALEAYNKALNEGKTRVRRIPVMLIGQHRSGKTSLKKSLRGIRFNPDEISTVGIDVDPSYFKVTTEIWKTGETDQEANTKDASSYEQHTARLVVKKLREGELIPEESSVESVQSEDSSLVDMVTPSANTRSEGTLVSSLEFIKTGHDEFPLDKQLDVSASPGASRVSDFDDGSNVYNTLTISQRTDPTNRGNNRLTTSKIPDEIETLIKKLLQEVDKVGDEEDIYSVLWDFGGQSVYYTTHPLFLTSRALYLLVYDLSQDPHKTAHPVTKQGMYKTIQDSFETKSNLDYLDFWMTSVASLASRDSVHTKESDVLPEKLPPVFLVCTNADRPYGGADCLALARKVYGSLQGKSCKNHLCNGFFVVDNTKSGGESECSEVARLRHSILAVANELPLMKEEIPIQWLRYEKVLQVTLGEGHKWIYFEHAKRIAAEVCQIRDNQEFVTLLNFLHDQRILIHFDDTPELNKLIFLDPQWLIDVFKKVITVQLSDGHGKAEIKQLWHKLETTGILGEKLLKHVWSPLIKQQVPYESFIAVMEKFSLLCSWPSSDTSCNKQYLVPSMLMSHPPQNITELIASAELPSLFLKFEPGQVPSSLFPRLVLQFFQWGQKGLWSSLNPQLYKNFVRFYTAGDEDCSVVLLCHSSFIEIVVHRGNVNPRLVEGIQSKLTISSGPHHDSFEAFCAHAVYKQLSLMLECMRNEFCWLKNMIYQAGFICPVCCHGKLVKYCRTHHKQYCEQEDCLHFLSESEIRSTNQFIRCTRAAAEGDNKVHVKNFSAWLTSPSKQTATDEMNGRQFLSGERSEQVSHAQLPGNVIESLMSDSCHPKEIVLQMKESLHLDQMCLQHPNPETKRMIRCLAKRAKDSNRIEVVKHLREITPAGTTGPLLPGNLDIRNIPVCQMRELTIYLSSGEEWKDVAAKLGFSPTEIRYLDKRIPNPCEAALACISQRCHITVDDLYDLLTKCGYPVLADIL